MTTVPRYIDVVENGKPIRITVEDIHKYHGFHLPGGVAHATKVMQRVFPVLSPDGPPERREVSLRTCFPGQGLYDAFEMVTRCVTGGRMTIDESMTRHERGPTLALYVFEVTYRGKTVTAVVREGHVRDEFIKLGFTENRTPDQEARMVYLRQEMADRLLATPAEEVYDVETK
jgi:hypothetical protein